MRSKFFRLNTRDFLRGLLIAVLTALLTGLINIPDAGAVFTRAAIRPVLTASLSAALSCLLKCLATNSQDRIFTREPRLAWSPKLPVSVRCMPGSDQKSSARPVST